MTRAGSHSTRVRIVRRLGAAVIMLLLLGGCRSDVSMRVDGAYQPEPSGGFDFGDFSLTPGPRLGGLPWPGAFTLFEPVALASLGQHSYRGQLGNSEAFRGILYTCRGGFIDIAHARKTIDLCKYAAVRAEFALRNDWTAFRLKSMEPSIYTVRINYPPFWKSLTPSEKEALVVELSVRMGQRLAMLMMTWHETLTWFGYSSTVFPEKQSAFTYDDTGSHALGVLVAGRALRDRRTPWDQAVTRELSAALRQLGAVSPDQTVTAANAVENRWWSGGVPLRRQFEWGWDGKPIVARLVPAFAPCAGAVPYRYELPRLDAVVGRSVRGMMDLEIAPNVLQSGRILAVTPGEKSVIEVDRDMPLIMQYMEKQQIELGGAQSVRP